MKALLFDLDETIVDRGETMRRFLIQQIRRFHPAIDLPVDAYVTSVIHHQKNGYENKLKAYELACEELLVDTNFAKDLFLDFNENYGDEAVPFNGVKEVLEELSNRYSLAIVTNGRARCQNAKIDYLGIRHLFQVIIISEEFGAKKPDPKIFEACLNELGCGASNAIFIGDNPQNDLEPAKKLGMKVIWVRNPHFDVPQEVDGIVDSVALIEGAITKIYQRADQGGVINSESLRSST